MKRIIIIEDNSCSEELNEFLRKHKTKVRFNSSLEEFNSDTKYLFETIVMEHNSGKKFVLSSGEKTYMIRIDKIASVSVKGPNTVIRQDDGQILEVSQSIEYIWRKLSSYNFLRTHENHIIHPGFVVKINTGNESSVLLKNEETIPVDGKWKENVLDFFKNKRIGIF